jgi:hypothetical protein
MDGFKNPAQQFNQRVRGQEGVETFPLIRGSERTEDPYLPELNIILD